MGIKLPYGIKETIENESLKLEETLKARVDQV
jgi:hypothetical protein